MRKILFVLLPLFQNIYAQKFFDILSKEDNVAEYDRMWYSFKNHFRTKINVDDKELKVFKKIGEIIEKNSKIKNKKKRIFIADEDLLEYEKIKTKIGKNEVIEVLLDFIETTEYLNENKDKNSPFDAELIKNILLHGSEGENRLLSKINISGSLVTEMAQALNFLKPEKIEEKINKIKNFNDCKKLDYLNDLFNILRDNEIDFVKLLNNKKAYDLYKYYGHNRYIDISDTLKKSKTGGEVFYVVFCIVVESLLGLGIAIFLPFAVKLLKTVLGALASIVTVSLFIVYIFVIKTLHKNLYNPSGFYDLLTEKYKSIKKYVSSMKSIYFKIKEDTNLFSLYKEKLTACKNIFEKGKSLTERQIEMLNLLDLIPVDWKYGKRNGKATAEKFCRFFLLFEKHKNIFKKPLLEIANIGADLNTVNLLRNKDMKNKWCLPTLIYQNLPFLEGKEVWSAVVGQGSSVTNDICFGINEQNKKGSILNHMVLAGMNAGGKTTFLKTVCGLLLLAQGIGICNASEVTMTPYDKIFCMIDVSSDPERNFSEFQNQLYMCDRFCLLNGISKLKKKKIFLVTDEALMGTNTKDYNVFMNKLIKDITSNVYLHSINAVHMSALVEFADTHPDKHIHNYRMNTKVLKNQQEKELEYTYKVISGVAEEQIAQALARQMYKDGKLKTKILLEDY